MNWRRRERKEERSEVAQLHVHRWNLIRSYTTAGAILAFPLLFLLDFSTKWNVSPILPGMIIIVACWLVFPIIIWEITVKVAPPKHPERMARQTSYGRIAIGVSLLVFFVWLAVVA